MLRAIGNVAQIVVSGLPLGTRLRCFERESAKIVRTLSGEGSLRAILCFSEQRDMDGRARLRSCDRNPDPLRKERVIEPHSDEAGRRVVAQDALVVKTTQGRLHGRHRKPD